MHQESDPIQQQGRHRPWNALDIRNDCDTWVWHVKWKMPNYIRERHLKLAEILENLPLEARSLTLPLTRFDIQTVWCAPNFGLDGTEDGFVACPVGIASMHPWFREHGFVLTDDFRVSFAGTYDWDAVSAFFDIPPGHASHLFSGKHGPQSPQRIAACIREFVALHDSMPDYPGDEASEALAVCGHDELCKAQSAAEAAPIIERYVLRARAAASSS